MKVTDGHSLDCENVSEAPLAWTEFGWATISLTPPNRDLPWLKMPEKHIYLWDDGGWSRVSPPERAIIPDGDLNHG